MDKQSQQQTFLVQARERLQHTLIDLLGIRLLEVDAEHALGDMPFTPQLQQLTGVFHAGALITLADTIATFAALFWSGATLENPGERFPLTIQLSTNLLRNTNQGIVQAEARAVHRGRTTTVVETQVKDDHGRLLLVVTTTHLWIERP